MASVSVQNAGRPTNERLQDHGGDVQAFPGVRGEDRQGLHPEDDRIWEELQAAASRSVTMLGMRKVAGKGVTCDAPPNPERRG